MFIVLFFLPPGGLVLSRLRRQFLSTQLAVTFYDVVQVHHDDVHARHVQVGYLSKKGLTWEPENRKWCHSLIFILLPAMKYTAQPHNTTSTKASQYLRWKT